VSQRISHSKIRNRRRLINFAWMAGAALVTIILLYKEQIELLYLLATLSVTILLIIVAFADLSGAKQIGSQVNERENPSRR
jgi:hypothetical protein